MIHMTEKVVQDVDDQHNDNNGDDEQQQDVALHEQALEDPIMPGHIDNEPEIEQCNAVIVDGMALIQALKRQTNENL